VKSTLGMLTLVLAALPVWGEQAPAADYSTIVEEQREELNLEAQKLLSQLHDVAQKTGSASELNVRGTVTSDLARSFADVPPGVVFELDEIQGSLRSLVMQAAGRAEERHRKAMLDDPEVGDIYGSLPSAAAARLDGIVAAVAENNVAIVSVYFAVQLFVDMNNQMIAEARSAQSPMRKRELYLTQAAHVYETSKVATEVIGAAQLRGLEALGDMRDENQSRIARRLAELNLQRRKLRDDIQAGRLDEASARRMERTYVQIIKANLEVVSAWDRLLSNAGAQQDFFGNLTGYVSRIKQKQQLARFQLDTLRDVLMIGGSLEPLEQVDDRLLTADQLPLLVLDPATVLRLVGGGGTTDVSR
jgi:hypothetical protein